MVRTADVDEGGGARVEDQAAATDRIACGGRK
jgi:hypothetical protein